MADGARATIGAIVPRLQRTMLVLAILGAGFAIDSAAFDGFDAPKRLVSMLAIALAALVLLAQRGTPEAAPWSPAARRCAFALLFAVAGLVVSTAMAADAERARDALRATLVFALLLPLGASRALEGRGVRVVACALAVGITGNAVLSLLQTAGASLPLELSRLGGRYPTGALLGNEGYVALACALVIPATLVLALSATPRLRVLAAAGMVLGVATIAMNRQLTAALAASIGILAVLMLQRGHTRALRAMLLAGLALAFVAATPPLRAVAIGPWLGHRIPDLQSLTTYRLGAWAAAEGMWRERPWTGFGPGAFEAQSQTYRLEAERALRQRLVPPPNATHFVQAHNDYLQLAAEAGLPALLAALAALVLLLGALSRRAVTDPEARALCGVLIAAAVAALAWFPLQIPLLCILVLLAAGRGWRLIARVESAA